MLKLDLPYDQEMAMEHDLVIAATDGSGESLRAVEWAAREAAMRDARLRIVSVPTLRPLMSCRRAPEGTPDAVR